MIRFAFLLIPIITLGLVGCGNDHRPIGERIVTETYQGLSPEADGQGSEPLVGDPNQSSGTQRQLSQTLLEAVVKQGVPEIVAKNGFAQFDQKRQHVKRDELLTLIDFTKHSSKKRFYIINTVTGKVSFTVVAHGSGSDPQNDGYAKYFSNVEGSLKSSLGSYIISEKYISDKFGKAMRLDGVDTTNSNVRTRAIVMHGSNYVEEGKNKQGRSWGCPALSWTWIANLIPRLEDGSFMFAYGIGKQMSAKMLEQYLNQLRMLAINPMAERISESEDAPFDGE